MLDYLIDNIWFVAFFAWGLPLGIYRSRFRKIIYQTDSWLINVKPVFGKELKGLVLNIYPNNRAYKRLRIFYASYLIIYTLLLIAYIILN